MIGFIDSVNEREVKGWIDNAYKNYKMQLMVDGIPHTVEPKFHARPNLMAQSIDGVGFACALDTHLTHFRMQVRLVDDERAPIYIPFSETHLLYQDVAPLSNSFKVDASDIATLVDSINVDSLSYINFCNRFGAEVARLGVEFDVVMIDGTYGSISTRYRLFCPAEYLTSAGYSVLYINPAISDLETFLNIKCRVAVFFRAPYTGSFSNLAQAMRSRGTKIVFDIDDLAFDDRLIGKIDGVRFLNSEERINYAQGMRQYLDFIEYSDIVTCSTNFLSEYIANLTEKNVIIIPNTVGKNYLEYYAKRSIERPVDADNFVVGYYSGSRTHQEDFRCCYDALVTLLSRYPDIRLRIVGELDLAEFPKLSSFSDQIDEISRMDYFLMLEDIANCDVVLAPLEIGDPFCESKSELKFFEAALLERVAVCSATDTYRRATQDGRYARLAETAADWLGALEELYLDRKAMRQLALAAKHYVLDAYHYAKAGKAAEHAYFRADRLPERKALSLVRHTGSVGHGAPRKTASVLIPDVIIGGGGHRKILSLCKGLSEAGYHICLHVESGRPRNQIALDIRQYFYDFDFEIINSWNVHAETDIIICTHWLTAYSLRLFERPELVYYFVQDYEPLFHSASSDYAKALSTYRMGFNIVCFGNWVADRLAIDFGVTASVIPFTLDSATYFEKPNIRKSVDVLFFARPSQPRRCFELGVEALQLAYRKNPSLRIGLYGEDQYSYIPFVYHNFGLITSLETLADIYRKSTIGICFSSTNPSLVGYEMIACGCALIDLRVPGFENNFGGEGFVSYADAYAESILEKIDRNLLASPERDARVALGREFISKMEGDESIARKFLDIIERR
ncbi:MAG: glycosyltransferase [Sphingomonadales bacterium]|nr:glycosyltransferase [Sphingomonadales bacterium]